MQILLAIFTIAAVLHSFWAEPPRIRSSTRRIPIIRNGSFGSASRSMFRPRLTTLSPLRLRNLRIQPKFPRYAYQYTSYDKYRPSELRRRPVLLRPYLRRPSTFRPSFPPVLPRLPIASVRKQSKTDADKSVKLTDIRRKLVASAENHKKESKQLNMEAKALLEKMPIVFAKYRALESDSKSTGKIAKDKMRFAVQNPYEYRLIQAVLEIVQQQMNSRRKTAMKSAAIKTNAAAKRIRISKANFRKTTVRSNGMRASSKATREQMLKRVPERKRLRKSQE